MRRWTTALVLVSIPVCAGGCYTPLFPENAPRSQFEQQDLMRFGNLPLEEEDDYGRLQPALRTRLRR